MRPGDNVLVVGSSFEPAVDAACVDLHAPDAEEFACFAVTFVDSPAERVAVWDRYADGYPSRVAFVDVEASIGGVSPADSGSHELERAVPSSVEVTVDRVSSPGNLTRLGVAITDRLDEVTSPDRRLVVCFDSVSTLLQYASTRETFRFLQVLTDRFRVAEAVAHFHLEAGAHDEETVETLRGLFDVACEYGDDEWTIQSRYDREDGG